MKNKINEQLFKELLSRAILGEGAMIYNETEMVFTHGRTLDVYVVNDDTIDRERADNKGC